MRHTTFIRPLQQSEAHVERVRTVFFQQSLCRTTQFLERVRCILFIIIAMQTSVLDIILHQINHVHIQLHRITNNLSISFDVQSYRCFVDTETFVQFKHPACNIFQIDRHQLDSRSHLHIEQGISHREVQQLTFPQKLLGWLGCILFLLLILYRWHFPIRIRILLFCQHPLIILLHQLGQRMESLQPATIHIQEHLEKSIAIQRLKC